jgi:hypothetical protein
MRANGSRTRILQLLTRRILFVQHTAQNSSGTSGLLKPTTRHEPFSRIRFIPKQREKIFVLFRTVFSKNFFFKVFKDLKTLKVCM